MIENIGRRLYEVEFLSHHLVGANPADENGSWATIEEAVLAFSEQFAEVALLADKGGFLFVRRAPVMQRDRQFEGGTRYKMVGRFSVVKAANWPDKSKPAIAGFSDTPTWKE